MTTWHSLNRRHKVVLFLTLVVTGSTLVWGGSIRTSLGIILLGIALAWAVGSEAVVGFARSRIIHILILLVGISLFVPAIVFDWDSGQYKRAEFERSLAAYRRKVEDFRANIPRLAKRYPLSEATLRQPPFSIIHPLTVDASVKADAYQAFCDSFVRSQFDKIDIPVEARDRLWEAKRHPHLLLGFPYPMPRWAAEALAAGVNLVGLHRGWTGGVELHLRRETPGNEPAPPQRSVTSRLARVWPFIVSGLLSTSVGLALLLGVKPKLASTTR